MAKEGYTQIPNKILEALAKTKLSPYESKYVFALLRKTYGYHKYEDYIANSQFAKLTEILRQHICRTEIKLLGRKIIICVGNKIGINNSFNQWQKLPAEVIITRRGKSVTYKGNKKLPTEVATKETKEIKQKKEDSFLKERIEAYKNGDRKFKPFNRDNPIRFNESRNRLEVLEDGDWLEFCGTKSDIEWR